MKYLVTPELTTGAAGLGLVLWLHNVQHAALPVDWVRNAALAVLVVYLVATRHQSQWMTRVVAGICVTVTAVLVLSGSPLMALRDGADFALMFLGFLPAIALIRAAFEVGPQIGRIGRQIDEQPAGARSDSVLLLSHIAGSVLTLGTLAVVGPILREVEDADERRKAANICLRGLCLAILWTPFTVGMGFAGSHLPQVPLWQAMLCGALIAAVGLAASLRGGADLQSLLGTLRSVRPAIAPVATAAALLIAADSLTGWGTLRLIILLMPPLCLLYIGSREPAALPDVGRRLFHDLGRLGNDMLLFTCSITMGFALSANPVFNAALANVGLSQLPPVEIMGLLVLLVIACALAGLHVTVTGAIAVAIAAGLDGALSDLSVFTLILFAWSTGAMLSVSSLALAVSARTFGVPMWRLIYGPNLVFAVGLGTMLTLGVGTLEWVARP